MKNVNGFLVQLLVTVAILWFIAVVITKFTSPKIYHFLTFNVGQATTDIVRDTKPTIDNVNSVVESATKVKTNLSKLKSNSPKDTTHKGVTP